LLGVNDHNIAVGFYVDTTGATHGYTYDIATKTFSANIDDPNGVGATTAAAINDRDQIVGFYTDGNGVTHGFFESGGVFKTIDAANATATSLLGLNNFGEAVGFDIDAAGAMHGIICDVVTGATEELDDQKTPPCLDSRLADPAVAPPGSDRTFMVSPPTAWPPRRQFHKVGRTVCRKPGCRGEIPRRSRVSNRR